MNRHRRRDEGVVATRAGTPELTAALIDRVRGIVDDGLPAHVLERAKHVVLDWMIATSFARDATEIEAMREALLPVAGGGSCPVVGTTRRADVFTASLINGTAAHLCEIDDTLAHMYGHPSGIVAGVLALAVQQGVSGREVLEAIIAGYEAAVYVGMAVGRQMHHNGFEGIGVLGTVASAIAAGVLLKLGPGELEMALGIATSTQAAGLRSATGTSSKSLLAGTGGQRGVTSALLARGGFGGPARSLEHPFGLAQALADHTTAELALPAFDERRYGIERAVFKFHSACHALHSTIESALELTGGQGLAPDRVEAVTVTLAPRALEFADVKDPRTTLQARFSASHVVCAYLTGLPRGFSPIGAEAIDNEDLVTLRRRVEVRGDAAYRADEFTGLDLRSQVTVAMRDGGTLEASVPAHGVAGPDELPDQWQRLRRKADRFASPTAADGWAARVAELVAGLDRADGVAELTGMLA